MRKLINQPDRFVDETLEGLTMAHEDQLALLESDRRVVVRARRPEKPKVAIQTGGPEGEHNGVGR